MRRSWSKCGARPRRGGRQAPCASDGEVQTHAAFVRVDVKERNRLRLCIDGRPPRTPHVLRALPSRGECEALAHQVAGAASATAGSKSAVAHYATTDFALRRAPAAAAWVREHGRHAAAGDTRLYDIAPSRLALRESFVVRYEPQLQPSLALHKDATCSAVTAARTTKADGGGTAFAEPARRALGARRAARRRAAAVRRGRRRGALGRAERLPGRLRAPLRPAAARWPPGVARRAPRARMLHRRAV